MSCPLTEEQLAELPKLARLYLLARICAVRLDAVQPDDRSAFLNANAIMYDVAGTADRSNDQVEGGPAAVACTEALEGMARLREKYSKAAAAEMPQRPTAMVMSGAYDTWSPTPSFLRMQSAAKTALLFQNALSCCYRHMLGEKDDTAYLLSLIEDAGSDMGSGMNRKIKKCWQKLTRVARKRGWTDETPIPKDALSVGECFIATAAFGHPDHPTVLTYREFRDRSLAKHLVGRGFVSLYYRISPPIAGLLRRNGVLRLAVRRALAHFARYLR